MNEGINKDQEPYKFKFELIEPDESANSIFDISPKQAVMGPHETQTFTVTFSPNKEGKGPGQYKSIILATPKLSNDELQIAEDAAEFTKKGALGIVSFNVTGESIEPILTLDKKERIDGLHHLNFKCWSIRGEPEAPNPIQKVTFTNNNKADLIFNIQAEGPFEIYKTKTNTNAKHPSAPSTPLNSCKLL